MCTQKLLPERDVADDGYKEYLKGSMARDLGAYAAQQGYIVCMETVKYGDGRPWQQSLLMRAAFLLPIEPKFNPGDDSGEEDAEDVGSKTD